MEIKKKYVVKCHKCGKNLELNLKISRIAHMSFIDDMYLNEGSECQCLKCTSGIRDLAILFKQLLWLNDNRDEILKKNLEKQD